MLRRQFLSGSCGLALMATTGFSAGRGAISAEPSDAGPLVQTVSGMVRGGDFEGGQVFRGIPFAAPPIGANRLAPPQAVAKWDGEKVALSFGPKPWQGAYPPGVAEYLPEVVGPGDDCLTLNIWTPAADGGGRPVMVFVPGGMFEYHGTGAATYYDGQAFARDGVVLVTINYRVGAEGFLYLGEDAANLGLLDQIAALHWVQENIAGFGGSPSDVTIFGESAGGMSVATLMTMPRAKGLFHRAIIESGNTPFVNSVATAELVRNRLAAILGVEPTRDGILAVPVDKVIDAQGQMRVELSTSPDPAVWGDAAISSLPWGPVVDGRILPQAPAEAIRAGVAADIDLLVGSNTEETRMFLVPGGAIDAITEEMLAGAVAGFGLSANGLSAYRAALPGASPGELFSAIQTDWYWRLPAERLADAHAAAGGATYMYEFAWRSPQLDGRLGAAHSMEIPFVFDTLELSPEALLGANPPQALADRMHGVWVGFGKTGDPGWERYDAARRATMRFDVEAGVVDDPLAERRGFWALG